MHIFDFKTKELNEISELSLIDKELLNLIEKHKDNPDFSINIFHKGNAQQFIKSYFEKQGFLVYKLNPNSKGNSKKLPEAIIYRLNNSFPLVKQFWNQKLDCVGVPDYICINDSLMFFVEVKHAGDGIRLEQLKFALDCPLDVKFIWD